MRDPVAGRLSSWCCLNATTMERWLSSLGSLKQLSQPARLRRKESPKSTKLLSDDGT